MAWSVCLFVVCACKLFLRAIDGVGTCSSRVCAHHFPPSYTPNKEWRLFRDIVRVGQPGSAVSVRLVASRPGAWVRLEALHPVTGAVVARTFGRGSATLVALPPVETADADAAAEACNDGSDLGGEFADIERSLLEEASLVLQGSVESRSWRAWPALRSNLPWTSVLLARQQAADAGQPEEPTFLQWDLDVSATVGGFKMWEDLRTSRKQAALVASWETRQEGRQAEARAVRRGFLKLLDPSLPDEEEEAEGKAADKVRHVVGRAPRGRVQVLAT